MNRPCQDLRWQAKAGNDFAASDFKVDWQRQIAICPAGKTSTSWTPTIDGRNNEVIKIKFARPDCAACPSLHLCTRTKEKRWLISLRPGEQYKALQAARQQALTDDYKAEYAKRAGIEGTRSWLKSQIRKCLDEFGTLREAMEHILKGSVLILMAMAIIQFTLQKS